MRTVKEIISLGSSLGFVLLVLLACGGNIRVVKASKQGGEIALIGDRQSAMEKARAEMDRVCGGPWDIQEEGEQVIGTVTNEQGQATQGTGIFGQPVTNTSTQTETTQKTEWRVKYVCKNAQASAPPPSNGPSNDKGDIGESCAKRSDCKDGLRCHNDKCARPPSSEVHELIVRF
jgi:hypothetical protein